MLTLDDLKELGLDVPRVAATPPVGGADGDAGALPRLERLSGPSKALHSVWAGQRVTCLQAPPGSGKSTSVVDLLVHLLTRLGLNVVVACPTRAQAVSLGERLYPKLPGGMFQLAVNGSTPEMESVSDGVRGARRTHPDGPGVTVMTLAAAGMQAPACDLFVVDEAYQATFADVAAAAAKANQLLLVGDPGQIGPVVTVETGVWDALRMAPHLRAMQVFQRRKDAETFSIDRTYRLGPVTTAAIQPLYEFTFESRRPERSLLMPDGTVLPEVGTMPLGQVDSADDQPMLMKVALWAKTLTECVLREDGASRALQPQDVAIVVARNSQSGALTGMMAMLGVEGVTVGTADKLQGGEWAAVVALDACAGNDEPNDYLTSLGRLCVMASRHRTHLTWCFADGWRELLAAADMPGRERRVAVAVREGLAGQPRVAGQVAA